MFDTCKGCYLLQNKPFRGYCGNRSLWLQATYCGDTFDVEIVLCLHEGDVVDVRRCLYEGTAYNVVEVEEAALDYFRTPQGRKDLEEALRDLCEAEAERRYGC